MSTAISMTEWAENSVIDYMTKHGEHPISVLLESKPGEGKSTFVETVMPKYLQAWLLRQGHGANATHAAYRDALARMNSPEWADMPDDDKQKLQDGAMAVPTGGNIHWSSNGTVCVISDIAANRDPMDFRGFLVPTKERTSFYTLPDLIALERKAYAAGAVVVVLFLDELLQADHLTQKVLSDGLLNHRFGSYTLDRRTWIIGATNRQQDGAGVNRALSILRNRINTMPVYLHVDTWIDWATSTGLEPMGIVYAKSFPGNISIETPPKDGPFPSWRSFTDGLNWLSAYKDFHGITDSKLLPIGDGHEYAQTKVAGFVGVDLARSLASHAQLANELPDMADVIANPHNAPLPDIRRMDAHFAMSRLVIHQATSKNIDPLWTYTMRLLPDLQVSTAKGLIDKAKGVLVNSPKLLKWSSENSELINSAIL